MLPVEVIVRGYITGSGWVDYGAGRRLRPRAAAGLQQCEKLPAPIFTPSTKAALGEHDENIDRARVAETIGAPRAEELEAAALKVRVRRRAGGRARRARRRHKMELASTRRARWCSATRR